MRKSLWSATPAMARGCSACSMRAATPPTNIEQSPCTRQVVLAGPNQPASPVDTKAGSAAIVVPPRKSRAIPSRTAAWANGAAARPAMPAARPGTASAEVGVGGTQRLPSITGQRYRRSAPKTHPGDLLRFARS